MTRTEGGVRVTTAALSAEESAAVYGVPLAEKSIQPVWIEVENREERAYYLLSPGTRSELLPGVGSGRGPAPGRVPIAGRTRSALSTACVSQPRPARRHALGLRSDNLDEGMKLIQLDLVTSGHASLLDPHERARLPLRLPLREVFKRAMYPPEKIVNYTDDAALRAALEALPCCVTNEGGSKNGDPLNLVVVGGLDEPSRLRASRLASDRGEVDGIDLAMVRPPSPASATAMRR